MRTRIYLALNPPHPFGATTQRGNANDAREALQRTIDEFFAAVTKHDSTADATPPVRAIRAEVGIGKSDATRRGAAKMHNNAVTVVAVPTHKLGAQASAAATDLGVISAVWRGREAANPDQPGEKMCMAPERVEDAKNAGENIQTAVCKFKDKMCPHFSECAYQAQARRTDKPIIWYAAHEMLFHEKPAIIGDIAALIVDEKMYDAGLDGHLGRPCTLSLGTLENQFPLSGIDGQRLSYILAVALDALRDHPDSPANRAAMIAANLTDKMFSEAYALIWRCKIDPGMHPGQTDAQRKASVAIAEGNKVIRRLAMFFRAMEALLAPNGPEASGWVSLGWQMTKEGQVRVIRLKGRKNIRFGWVAPTLAIDATLDMNLIKPYWPHATLAADLAVEAPHQRIFQVTNRSYSKAYFDIGADGEDPEDAPPLTRRTGQTQAGARRRRPAPAPPARHNLHHRPALRPQTHPARRPARGRDSV